MKKTVALLFLILVFNVNVFASVIDFTADSFDVNVINGETYCVKTDVAPCVKDKSLMIPLRLTAEIFGNTVFWDDETSTVFINDNIKYKLGENVLYKDEEQILLDVIPFETNGRILVSKSFISCAFSYNISYLPQIFQVIITDEKPLMNINGYDVPLYELSYLVNADRDKYPGDTETLIKAGISNLYDTYILYSNAKSNEIELSDEETKDVIENADGTKTLKSIYTSISLKYRLADKYSDILSSQSVPKKDEVLKYIEENNMKDSDYDTVSYNLGYEKFVGLWQEMYENADEVYYMTFDEISEILK